MKSATTIRTDVISDAREAHEETANRIKRAEKILYDLGGGGREYDTITLTRFGDYILVDDGADKWLGDYDTYARALESVLTACIEKGMYDDPLDGSEYDHLCNDCSALYSRIGSGEYNNKTGELLTLLAETLDADEVAEIAYELGIENDE